MVKGCSTVSKMIQGECLLMEWFLVICFFMWQLFTDHISSQRAILLMAPL